MNFMIENLERLSFDQTLSFAAPVTIPLERERSVVRKASSRQRIRVTTLSTIRHRQILKLVSQNWGDNQPCE